MVKCVVGFGANLGTQQEILSLFSKAVGLLSWPIVGAASLYSSAGMEGARSTNAFFNTAVAFEVENNPTTVLRKLLSTETTLGRKRVRWHGPRNIDLDLLLIGDRSVHCPGPPPTIVPHPRLHDRRFALEPAIELLGSDYQLHGHALAFWHKRASNQRVTKLGQWTSVGHVGPLCNLR